LGAAIAWLRLLLDLRRRNGRDFALGYADPILACMMLPILRNAQKAKNAETLKDL